MDKFIKQAKALMAQAEKKWKRDGGWNVPCEMQAYALFVCNDEGVKVVGSGPTVSDFNPLITSKNMLLLAMKYDAHGFVIKRTPKGVAEWSYVPAKAKGVSRG